MKLQYQIDSVGKLTGSTRLVADDVAETAEYKNGWDNDGHDDHVWANGNWVGHDDGRPDTVPEPTDQDQINSQLLKSFATQQLTNATLVKQIAELQKGGN